jgi:hypothetical protein
MAESNRVTTRHKNATQHPGDNEVPKRKRRTKAEMEVVKREREEAKQAKEAAKQAKLQRIAQLERRVRNDEANDLTPRPAQSRASRKLVRCPAYANLETMDVSSQVSKDDDTTYEPPTDGPEEDSGDTEYERPRKKAKDSKAEKVTEDLGDAKKGKSKKTSIRDAIKALADNESADNESDEEAMRIFTSSGKIQVDKETPRVSARYVTPHCCQRSSMLTLDHTTVFYYYLDSSRSDSSDLKKSAGLIKSWAEKITSGSKKATNSRGSSTIPSLTTTATSRSIKSVPSGAIAKGSNEQHDEFEVDDVIIRRAQSDEELDTMIDHGGLPDEIEVIGLERDAAVSSPPKGKKRLMSSVSVHQNFDRKTFM